jgi:hypothetical protein
MCTGGGCLDQLDMESFVKDFELCQKEDFFRLKKQKRVGRESYQIYLETLNHYSCFAMYLFGRGIIPIPKDRLVSGVLISKIISDLNGIYHCLNNGLLIQALQLFRPCFEAFMTIILIFEKDELERETLYGNYVHIENWELLNREKKLVLEGIYTVRGFEKKYPKHLETSILMNYEKFRGDYHPKNPRHWAWKIFKSELNGKNPSSKDIAHHLQWDDKYFSVYSIYSKYLHASPLMSEYIQSDTGLTMGPRFDKLLPLLATKSVDMFHDLLDKASHKWALTDYDDKSVNIYLYAIRREIDAL